MKKLFTYIPLLLFAWSIPIFLFAQTDTHWAYKKYNYKINEEIVENPSVLFIGNSYTFYHDMPDTFTALAKNAGKEVYVETLTQGGARLSEFITTGTELNKTLESLLSENRFDYIFIQEQSSTPIHEENFITSSENIGKLNEKIKENGARGIVYMTWAYRQDHESYNNKLKEYGVTDREDMAKKLAERYMAYSEAHDLILSPVGLACWRVNMEYPEIEAYVPDGSHPSRQISYLAACVHFATIFRESPENIEYDGDLNKDTARILRRIAAKTVLQ